jgi:hypothetical protein
MASEPPFNPAVAAQLAVALAARTIQVLAEKGVIEGQEGLGIYEKALSNFGHAPDEWEAKRILKIIMPALPI